MDTRSEHYENLEEMEGGVEQLSDEGWNLQKLTRHEGEEFDADFVRRESALPEESSDANRHEE
ncbi:MAG: hypothetical protein M3Q29_18770 [Chloroflexota bacterium]|nr:hypothetical protein [Chloroflexota bacterium]